MAGDYPERRPPFRPTMPTPARMLALTEAVGDAAEAIEAEDPDALTAAMAVPQTGTEQRLMLMTAASMAVLVLQAAAEERGAVMPVTFRLPDTGGPDRLAAAMLNAMASGDADAAQTLIWGDDVGEMVHATVRLAHVIAVADDAVFTDSDGRPSGD